MTPALKASLEAAGASVVGYVHLRTYVIRARDGASLDELGQILAATECVVGTRLGLEMDSCAPEVWAFWQSGAEPSRALRVMLWPDATGAQAEALFTRLGCEVISATREVDGTLNLETPFVDVSGSRAQLQALMREALVQTVEFVPVLRTHNQASRALAKADLVVGAPYNLDGTGEIAAIWDGGAVQLHTDYGGRVTIIETGSTSAHATHVFGTILGSGAGSPTARGFAPAATGFSYNFGGSPTAERRLRRHTSQHNADNHSYGGASNYGGYDSTSSTEDVDNRDLLMLQCRSAGNDGAGDTTIAGDAGHKNAFIVAATEDNGTIASFSSRGPADDGRLNPFISANGVGLNSTVPTNAYDNTYSGTSMSSPSTCGSMILLSQLWRREHGRMGLAPDMARAIVAQTAVDFGNVGPDYRYGFGVIDVKAAADLVLSDKASNGGQLVRGLARPASVSNYSVNVTSSATPLRVTLSWLDTAPSGTATVALVNDLDLELIAPNATVNFPYSGLTGGGSQTTQFTQTVANRRDNVEQAIVNNPAIGTWTIRVKGFSLPDPTTPIGFVIATNRPVARDGVIYADPLNTGTPVAIPDNQPTGVARTFVVTQTKAVRQVRAYVSALHTARGNLSIRLRHPDNTEVLIEGNDTSTRDDIFGIFPDTRKYNEDVSVLYGKAANGTWTITVADNNAGDTGTIVFCSLEFEFDAPGTANTPPQADAGADFNIAEGAAGALNGTASFDPDLDPLTYAWTQIGGSPTIPLTGATTATPAFTAPLVTANTQFTFRVTVNDGRGGTDTDDVIVTVQNVAAPNNPPLANAGTDAAVNEGVTVNLSGVLSSDPDLDPLTFAWTQIAGTPSVTLAGAATATPSFTAPQVSAVTNLTFRLTVNDGRGGIDTDDVIITVNDITVPNNPPTAQAGIDRTVGFAALVQLDGSASTDPDLDPLTFVWTQTGGTSSVTLLGTGAIRTFTSPSVADILTFQLSVDDGRGGVDLDSVTITVQNTVPNTPPVANAGADQTVAFGANVTINGALSTDADSDPLSFVWVQTGGTATVTLTGTGAQRTFVAPATADSLTFQLTVNDGRGGSSMDTITVTVQQSVAGGGGGGGGKKDGGGCSSDEQATLAWVLLVALAALSVSLRASRRGNA